MLSASSFILNINNISLPPFNVRDLSLKDLQTLRHDFEHTTESEEVGELDIHMFTELLQRHFSVPEESAHELFHEIDASNNGGIDWDELSTYLLFFKEEEDDDDEQEEDHDDHQHRTRAVKHSEERDDSEDDNDDEDMTAKKNRKNDKNNNNDNHNTFSKSLRGRDRMMDITLIKDTTFRHADPTEGSFAPTSGFNHSEHITRIVCHPTVNKYFTSSRDGTVRSWNSDTFELNSIIHYNRNNVWMNDLALCHSGQRVVAVGSDRTVSFYDCKSEALWKGFVGVPSSTSLTTNNNNNNNDHKHKKITSTAAASASPFNQRSFLHPPGLCYPIEAKEIGYSRRKRRKMFREEHEKLERGGDEIRNNLSMASGRTSKQHQYDQQQQPSSSRLGNTSALSTTTSNGHYDQAESKHDNNNNNKNSPKSLFGVKNNNNKNDTNSSTGAKIRPLEAEYIILNDLKCSAMSVTPCERHDREGPMLLGLENGSVHSYAFEEPNVHRSALNATHIWKDLHPGSFVSAICYDSHLDCCFSGGGDGRIVALPLREPKTIEITRAASQIVSSSSSSSNAGLDSHHHHHNYKKSKDAASGIGSSSHSLTMRGIYRLHSLPEYRLLMSCGSERCVKLWSPTSGLMPPIVLESSSGGVIVDCCQMKSEPLIVTLDSEKVIKLWDLRTQRIVNQWQDSDVYRPHNTLSAIATDHKRQRIVSGLTAPVVHHLTREVSPFPQPWYKGHQKPIVRVLKAPSTTSSSSDTTAPSSSPPPSSSKKIDKSNDESNNNTNKNATTATTTKDAFAAATQKHTHHSKSNHNSNSTNKRDRIVTACEECVKVWNVSDGSLHATWTIPQLRGSAVTSGIGSDSTAMIPGVITSIAFDQIGRRLIIMTSNGYGFIVNFNNGLLLRELNPSKGPMTNKGGLVVVASSSSSNQQLQQNDSPSSTKNNNTIVVNDLTPPPASQHFQHISNSPQNYAQQQRHRFSNKIEGSYSQSSECSHVETLECSGERYVGCIQENNLLLWNDSQEGIAMDKKVDYILNVSLTYEVFCRLQPYRKGGTVHISEMSREELQQEKRMWRNTMPTCVTSCPPLYIAVGTDAGAILLFMMVPRFHLFRILGTVERTVTVHAITYSQRYDLLFAAMSDGRLMAHSIADRSICWSLDHREPLAERVPQLKSVCVLDRYVATTDSDGYVYFWSFYDDEDEDDDDDDDEHDDDDDDDDSNSKNKNHTSNEQFGSDDPASLSSHENRRSSAVFDSLQSQKKKLAKQQKNNSNNNKSSLETSMLMSKSKILIKRQQEHQQRTEQLLRLKMSSSAANPTTIYSQTQNLRQHHRLSLTSLFKTEESIQLEDAKEAAKSSITTFLPSTCHLQSEVTFIGALRAHKEEAGSCQLYFHFDQNQKVNSNNNDNNNNNNSNKNQEEKSSSSSNKNKLPPPRSLFCATSGSTDCQSRVFDVFTGAFIGFCGSKDEWRPHEGRERFLIKKKDYRRRSISGDQIATAVLLMGDKEEDKSSSSKEGESQMLNNNNGRKNNDDEVEEKLFRQASAKFLNGDDNVIENNKIDDKSNTNRTESAQTTAQSDLLFGGINVANDDDFFEDENSVTTHPNPTALTSSSPSSPSPKRRPTIVTIDENYDNNNNNKLTDEPFSTQTQKPLNDDDDHHQYNTDSSCYEDIAAISKDRIQKLTNTWIDQDANNSLSSPNHRNNNINNNNNNNFSKSSSQLSPLDKNYVHNPPAMPPQPAITVLSPLDVNDVGVDYYQLMSQHFVHLSRSMIRGINPLQGSAVFDPVQLANQMGGGSNGNSGEYHHHHHQYTTNNNYQDNTFSSSYQKPNAMAANHLNNHNNSDASSVTVMSPLSKMVQSVTTPKIQPTTSSSSHEERSNAKSVRFITSATTTSTTIATSSSSNGEKSILKASFGAGGKISIGDSSFMLGSAAALQNQENLVRVKNLKAKLNIHGGIDTNHHDQQRRHLSKEHVENKNDDNSDRVDDSKQNNNINNNKNPFIKEDKLLELRRQKIIEQTRRAKEDRIKQAQRAEIEKKNNMQTTQNSKKANTNTNNHQFGIIDKRDQQPLSSEDFASSSSFTMQSASTSSRQIPIGSSPIVEELLEMSMMMNRHNTNNNNNNNNNTNQNEPSSSFPPTFSNSLHPSPMKPQSLQISANPRGSPDQQMKQEQEEEEEEKYDNDHLITNDSSTTPRSSTRNANSSKKLIFDNKHHNTLLDPRMMRRRESVPAPDMFSLNPHSALLLQHKKQRERQQRLLQRGIDEEAKRSKNKGKLVDLNGDVKGEDGGRNEGKEQQQHNDKNVDDDDDDDLRAFLPTVQTARVHVNSTQQQKQQQFYSSSSSLTARNNKNNSSSGFAQNNNFNSPSSLSKYKSHLLSKSPHHHGNNPILPEINQSAIINARLVNIMKDDNNNNDLVSIGGKNVINRQQQNQSLPILDIARHGIKALFTEQQQRSSSSRNTGAAASNFPSPTTTTPGYHSSLSSPFAYATLASPTPNKNNNINNDRIFASVVEEAHRQKEYDELQHRISEWQVERQIQKLTAFISNDDDDVPNVGRGEKHQSEGGEDIYNKHNSSSSNNNNNNSASRRKLTYLPPLDVELRDERKMQLQQAKNLGIRDGTTKGARDRSDHVAKELEQLISSKVVLHTATGTVTTARAKKSKNL